MSDDAIRQVFVVDAPDELPVGIYVGRVRALKRMKSGYLRVVIDMGTKPKGKHKRPSKRSHRARTRTKIAREKAAANAIRDGG